MLLTEASGSQTYNHTCSQPRITSGNLSINGKLYTSCSSGRTPKIRSDGGSRSMVTILSKVSLLATVRRYSNAAEENHLGHLDTVKMQIFLLANFPKQSLDNRQIASKKLAKPSLLSTLLRRAGNNSPPSNPLPPLQKNLRCCGCLITPAHPTIRMGKC